ncbi:MAG: hypothetical protein KF908_06730 [Nitrosomonas sp.]|nr:hypothetical protein [Nitrosomonas sp.]
MITAVSHNNNFSGFLFIILVYCGVLHSGSVTAQFLQDGQVIPTAPVVDTQGYASGQLSRVGLQNKFNNAFNQAYAGQLLLGSGSGSFVSYGGFPLSLDNNPWPFCFDKDDYEMIEAFIGKDVVVEFKTPRRSSMLSCSAIAEFAAIYSVEENDSPDETVLEGNISTFEFEVSRGVEYGRITNAVRNRSISRTYYLTMQVGGSGNRFSHFIMNDRDLYEFAVKSLKAAVMVKVHYSERISGRGPRNRLYVNRIEIAGSNRED